MAWLKRSGRCISSFEHRDRQPAQPGPVHPIAASSQPIVFRALPERVVEQVVWYLNGTELARTGPPYEFVWEPTRGSHELLAVTPDKTAAKTSFFVE